jgi:hypothetical protein
MVTDLYQSAEWKDGVFPKLQNMALNISADEVRHSRQFEAMIKTMEKEGNGEARCYEESPEAAAKEEVRLLHEITRLENELVHRYLSYVISFSEHPDLSQRLFKNSIDHMRHWDKNSGLLVRLGSVIRIENSRREANGKEISVKPMPSLYPGTDRLSSLETLIPAEENLVTKYERLMSLAPMGDVRDELSLRLALEREHLFTQDWLLKHARKIRGLS